MIICSVPLGRCDYRAFRYTQMYSARNFSC